MRPARRGKGSSAILRVGTDTRRADSQSLTVKPRGPDRRAGNLSPAASLPEAPHTGSGKPRTQPGAAHLGFSPADRILLRQPPSFLAGVFSLPTSASSPALSTPRPGSTSVDSLRRLERRQGRDRK